MPLNKKGKHYANPAYGKMMEAGVDSHPYAKEEAYRKAGYMIKSLEIEYAENGFVVKCNWEKPKSTKMMEPGGYMEPTVKVFKTVPQVQKFVKMAFNEYRHSGLSYPGEGAAQPKAPLINRNKGVKGKTHNPGTHRY